MNLYTFWFYTLAACALLWGVFGIRTCVSVLLANSVLCFIVFGLAEGLQNSNLQYALILLYPVYLGVFFLPGKRLEALKFLDIAHSRRLALGLLLCFVLLLSAHWRTLSQEWAFIKATYVTAPEERPEALRQVFAECTEQELCRESHATLFRLALNAHDKDVLNVLLDSVSSCVPPSSTVVEAIIPMVDSGDQDNLLFLMQAGLKPSTPIVSIEGKSYPLLAYAALTTDNHDLVKAIAAHNPQDVLGMPEIDRLLLMLEMRQRTEMVRVLREAAIVF